MGFKDDIDSEIVNAVIDDYKKAESWLNFSSVEIKNVFSPEELKEAEVFLEELKKATNENDTAAMIINNANKYGKVIVKLLRLAKIV